MLEPLGQWIKHTTKDWLDNWDWFIHQDSRKLYHQTKYHTWEGHTLQRYRHHAYNIDGEGCTIAMDIEYRRVTTSSLFDRIRIKDLTPRVTIGGERNSYIILDAIYMINPKLDWFNSHLSCSVSTSNLRRDIISGKAFAISDGSYYPMEEVGVGAWTISIPDGKVRIREMGVIPGSESEQNSYRAELDGQLGTATCIESVDVPQGEYKIKTVCDRLGALNKVGLDKEYIKCSAKHVDMISMITDLWNKSKFTPM